MCKIYTTNWSEVERWLLRKLWTRTFPWVLLTAPAMACGSEEYSCTSTTPQSSDAFSFFNLEAEGATLKRPCSPHMHGEHRMIQNDQIPQEQRWHAIGWWSLRSWLADFTFWCWMVEINAAPNYSNFHESSKQNDAVWIQFQCSHWLP